MSLKNKLLPPEERERRVRIIEQGLRSEFWIVLKHSIEYFCAVKTQEVLDLHDEGHHDEAEKLALQIKAMQRILQEPSIIMRENRSLNTGMVEAVCNYCRGAGKRIINFVSKDKEAQINTGGTNARTY